MRVKMVFFDWRKQGVSIYNTPEGLDLSTGDFHSGTCFDVELAFQHSGNVEEEFKLAIESGYQPTFYFIKD